MSALLPQVFFTSILLVAIAFMARGAIDTNARLYATQVLQATSALDAAHDSVTIDSVTPGSPPEDLTIALRNNGKRDIANWRSLDIIVVYTTAVGATTESLTHTEGGVLPGTWAPVAGAGDLYEPGILNLDETIEVRVHLSTPPQPGNTARLILTLEGGATISHAFTFP